MKPLIAASFMVGTLVGPWTVAHADDFYDPGGSTYLDLGRFQTPFKYFDGDHTAHVGRYGVAFSQGMAQDMSMGLHGGYLTLDVDGEPKPLPVSFSGRYLGVSVDYEGSENDHANLSGELAYTWHEAQNDSFPSNSQITWYQTWIAFGPVLRYDRWRLTLGAYYQNLTGNETDDSPQQQLDLHAPRHLGGYLGIDFYFDRDNAVGLHGTGGARQGIQLVFRKDF